MNELKEYLASPLFWIGVVLVGIVINLMSAYLRNGI